MIVRSRQVTKNILVKEMARSGLVDAAKLTGPRPRETLAVTLGGLFHRLPNQPTSCPIRSSEDLI